jgi:hypothetical protein
MGRFLAGVAAALLLTTAGLLWWNGRAADRHLPGAPTAAAPTLFGTGTAADPPEASEATREQRRFNRYDKDRDGKVSREEYFAARHKAYAKLDANRDGRLDFDEWAAKSIVKFSGADQDHSATLNPQEFATTAVKRKTGVAAPCPSQAPHEDD